MKTLSLLFFAVLLSFSAFSRVRTSPPDSSFRVTGVRIVDSVTFIRYSFDFGKNAVVNTSCGCVVRRKDAVYLFGFDSLKYVKPKEICLC